MSSSWNPIPRYVWDSEEALQSFKTNAPFVLVDCPLVTSAVNKWTFEYLASVIPESFLADVYSVSNVDFNENSYALFHYWDSTKNANGYEFRPPTTKLSLSFAEFLRRSSENNRKIHLYLQQAMVQEMGDLVMQEYMQFSLETALKCKTMGGWDGLTTNLLLCGPPGAITTSHFDEQQNLFAQLSGRKRVRLHSPSEWNRMYPYPLGHPRDRQAQVRLPLDDDLNPELNANFPEFSSAVEYRVDLEAGDILFVPQYWWHQMEALTQNVSISWWFKDSGRGVAGLNPLNLLQSQKIAIRRNIERIISEAAGGKQKAHNFFLAVAGGRVQIPVPPGATPLSPLLPTDIEAARNIEIQPNWPDVVNQAITLLSHVMPATEAPYFFKELVSGRFSCLDN